MLDRCLKKVQFFGVKEWRSLEEWLTEGREETEHVKKEIEQLREHLNEQAEERQEKVRTLLKENSDLKARNEQL